MYAKKNTTPSRLWMWCGYGLVWWSRGCGKAIQTIGSPGGGKRRRHVVSISRSGGYSMVMLYCGRRTPTRVVGGERERERVRERIPDSRAFSSEDMLFFPAAVEKFRERRAKREIGFQKEGASIGSDDSAGKQKGRGVRAAAWGGGRGKIIYYQKSVCHQSKI